MNYANTFPFSGRTLLFLCLCIFKFSLNFELFILKNAFNFPFPTIEHSSKNRFKYRKELVESHTHHLPEFSCISSIQNSYKFFLKYMWCGGLCFGSVEFVPSQFVCFVCTTYSAIVVRAGLLFHGTCKSLNL